MADTNNTSNKDLDKNEELTPHELLQKHIKDPNHHVTDEELKNVKVGADAESDEEINIETNTKEDEIEDLPKNDDLPNPYTVLGD